MSRGKAVVTGGANGIGRAICLALARDGFDVVAFDIVAATETIHAIQASGNTGRFVAGDVFCEADIQALFASIYGSIDVAVCCAGIQIIKPFLETTLADFDRIVGINLRGVFLTGREAARRMMSQPAGGRIINIASELAYTGRARYTAYCATKGGVVSLTRAMARELAPRILVNAVAPGPTDTAMVSSACMSEEELRAEVVGVPLGRIARPEEIARSVAFLAGPGGDYFTGQCISPNGGAVMF